MSHKEHPELKSSTSRLWALVERRARPNANVQEIDRRIWDLFGETWAVMFTDLSGFSRQVEAFGIVHFLQVIHEQKKLLLPVVDEHGGILVKIEADSFMILFKRTAVAVDAAVAMQKVCAQYNARKLPEEQVLLCVGIGHGPILKIGDDDVYGTEVNGASKLGEDIAKSNEILLTPAAHAQVSDKGDFERRAGNIPGATEYYAYAWN